MNDAAKRRSFELGLARDNLFEGKNASGYFGLHARGHSGADHAGASSAGIFAATSSPNLTIYNG